MGNFAIVRMAYYKHQRGAKVIAHIERKNEDNANIIDKSLTKENFGTSGSIAKRYEEVRQRHTELKGKRPRSDFNAVVEHVIVLSEEQAEKVLKDPETGKKALNRAMARYVKDVKAEFGFEPLGWKFHLDEGHIDKDTGAIKRNIHAQAIFYNYDFKNNTSPLRRMQKKGIDPKTGRTRVLNPHFEKLQDLVALAFKPLGFDRGVSRGKENRKNMEKADFVLSKMKNKVDELKKIQNKTKSELEEIEKQAEKKQEEIDNLKNTYSKLIKARAVRRFIRACEKYEKATKIVNDKKKKAAMERSEKAREKAAEEIKRKKEFKEMERKRWKPTPEVSREQREFLDQINEASASKVDLSKLKGPAGP